MGEYNYSAPYRGTGAALPEGYLNALMQPGRNIGAGLESAGSSIAEGIGKYYKNKEEKAGAQAAAEGAVAQYLGLSNLPQRQPGQQDEMVRDRYLGQVQDRQKDIINVVGEKTWQKFQDGKASTPEILGLTHSLGVYDTKKKEQQAVDFQNRQLGLSEANLAANIDANKVAADQAKTNAQQANEIAKLRVALEERAIATQELNAEEQRIRSKFERAAQAVKDGQNTSLHVIALKNNEALSKQLINDIDSNNTLSNALASNPRNPSESQTTYYTRIIDGIKTPIPWDVRGKMLAIAQNFDKNMPEVKTIDGRNYLLFNGTQTEISPKSKGNFVQAYTIDGTLMPNMWRDIDTNHLIQPSGIPNPMATAMGAAVADPQAAAQAQETQMKNFITQNELLSKYFDSANNNVGRSVTNPTKTTNPTNPTNPIPSGNNNLSPGKNGSWDFNPPPPPPKPKK